MESKPKTLPERTTKTTTDTIEFTAEEARQWPLPALTGRFAPTASGNGAPKPLYTLRGDQP